jgi:hypothetical protein
MTLLLALLLCWDANTEPDLSHYRVRFAERYVVRWIDCPCGAPLLPPCFFPPTPCPEYSAFAWAWHVVYEPRFDAPPCADEWHSFCFYKHPTSVDLDGYESVQPMLSPTVPQRAEACP